MSEGIRGRRILEGMFALATVLCGCVPLRAGSAHLNIIRIMSENGAKVDPEYEKHSIRNMMNKHVKKHIYPKKHS